MNWADVSQMPADLRDLLPWPLDTNATACRTARIRIVACFRISGCAARNTHSQTTYIEGTSTIDSGRSITQTVGTIFILSNSILKVIRERRQADREARHLNRPAVQVQSQLDPQHRPELHEFHNVQRQVEHRRRVHKKQSCAVSCVRHQ